MEVVYYFDETKGISPVKEYLDQFTVRENDTVKTSAWKVNIFAEIDKKIKYILVCNGRPASPIATPLHGYSFFEIRHRKEKDILIRILYFSHQNMMVLLSAFEKPAHYDTNKEKRKVIKQYNIADQYRIKFINNQSYEKY